MKGNKPLPTRSELNEVDQYAYRIYLKMEKKITMMLIYLKLPNSSISTTLMHHQKIFHGHSEVLV